MNRIALERRDFLRQAGTAMAGATISALGVSNPVQAGFGSSWPSLRPGDLFICVRGSSSNSVIPGHFDHIGIWDGANVVEAQFGAWYQLGFGGGVLSTPLQTFYDRYRTLMVYRYKSAVDASAAARYARDLVGQPYGIPRLSSGYTCVIVARVAYFFATRQDPGWVIPDHVAVARDFRWVGAK
ncbi:MAG: YiiX/YebB-like N1pC/P60 family cysteine hydrolase [Pirellulales bacterium]